MRVLLCIPCLLTGGTEIQTLSLVEALVSLGHEVATVCYYEHDARMVSRYEAAGSRVVLLSETGTARPQGAVAQWRHLRSGLRRAVRDFHPDAAHVQYMAPGALAILALRSIGVKRIIATSHTAADIYSPRSLQLLRFLTRRVLAGFQCITERAETGYFGSSRRIATLQPRRHGNHFTIHNNLPRHITLSDEPPRNEVTTIGVVSRLEQIKGMDLVVPAFARALARHPRLRLIVAGSGTLQESMRRQAEEAGATHAVEFLGRVEQSELNATYDRIDLLLMPSRSEGFGLTAVEAMARRCVPLVANTGGLPEVVEDEESGLLHAPESVEEMSRKIEELCADSRRFRNLSAGSRRRAEAFTAERYRKEIGEMYDKLISS